MGHVSTLLFPEVASEGADEDGVQRDSEGGVDQADPAPQLRLQRDPPVSDALEDKVDQPKIIIKLPLR